MINKILNYYCKIIKLETGYKPSNIYFLLFIIIISIISLLLRNIIYLTFQGNILIINTLSSNLLIIGTINGSL